MEEVKYIPGDLVKRKDKPNIILRVHSSSLSEVNDALYEVRDLEDDSFELYLWSTQIMPIPLTSAILEANGWKHKRESGIDTYTFGEDISNSVIVEVSRDKEFCLSVSDSTYINLKIKYIHQLQHLLFGLGLDSNLKV